MSRGLQIESIPISSWGLSLANLLEQKEWNRIRKEVYQRAGYVCQVCSSGDGPLHVHEVWKFDDRRRTQTLFDLVCVCKTCHDCIHFLRSTQVYDKKYLSLLIEHFLKVNSWSLDDLRVHLTYARSLANKRADRRYRVLVNNRELVARL